ncbi:hypothetical protein QAD02_017448 [Eretmocerus hayati]|uniref:Uncharacterized protein n=1 Tax=Eretmocerus hayati TaxID=131215 RepID=A0ACC2PFQ9_9HYME|nr:hypothetical protein QAD02_017448 [Eretmocerus hayati]
MFSGTLEPVNSKPAQISDYPWMVLVGSHPSSMMQCNGVIVAPHYVIATTHCASRAERMGWRILSGSAIPTVKGLEHEFDKLITFNNTGKKAGPADFAIIRVKQSFIYGKTRQPIPILDEKFQIRDSQPAYLVGFGRLTSNEKPSKALRVLSVKTLDGRRCKKISNTTRATCIYQDDPENKFAKNDYGALLVINGSLAGMVGQYYKKAGRAFNVYKKTSQYADWIHKNIDSTIDDWIDYAEDRWNEFMAVISLRAMNCLAADRMWRWVAPPQLRRIGFEMLIP